MKLFKYVDALEKIASKYWQAELIHASDDEWNSFHPVQFGPQVMYTRKLEHSMEDVVWADDKEDWVDYIKVVCLN
jgi:hypothetical protein